MKSIFLFLFLSVFADDINKIAAINRIRKEADEAYQKENYQEAARKYSILVDSLGQKDDRILLNLSNSYFKNSDTTHAKYLYNQLTATDNPEIQSLAHQQLGIMASDQKKYKESLFHFKNSLIANPRNEDSRYNYELLKKMMQNQQNQNQQNQQDQNQEKNKDQEQQDQQQDQQQQNDQKKDKQENQQDQQQQQQQQQQQEEKQNQSEQQEQENDQQQQNKNQPEPKKMEDMKISEEMAKKILEAMRNNEIQYLQQQRKKPTQPRDSGKPDW
jgi:Ca-activated chloride channel family protein